ncbi:MAG TPA: hypothetical protein ENN40_04315 [Candidatus Aminicenantes bacterium]|nr:hypothetical protein [Candidatus Aminicenantes bacterium]
MIETGMKTYSREKPLISMHVPKCAGSSMRQVLRRWFKGNLLLHYQDESQNRAPERHSLARRFMMLRRRTGICIHGHFDNMRGTGVDDYYPGMDQLIAILRDPFDLHVSTYFYVKRESRNGGRGAFLDGMAHPIVKNRWTLEEYLDTIRKSFLCRFLPPGLSPGNYRRVLEERFLYIGMMERFQRSVDALARQLDMPSVYVHSENVSPWDEPVPAGTREEFIRHNLLEMGIYQYVQERWGETETGQAAALRQD